MRSSPRIYLRALRPKQWTKNLAVYAALLFAKRVFDHRSLLHATLALFAFCFLAGGIYVLNDWVDRDKDRLHPEKRLRPIAAGLISSRGALLLWAASWALGFTLAWSVNRHFFALACGYVVLQIGYSLVLKRMVILDVMIIAVGFVMRVVGGGLAIEVPVSNWLYLCTLLLALFLGFSKRRHELWSLEGDAAGHRENLSHYSLPMLDQMTSVVAASCILAYGLYTVAPDTVAKVGSDNLKFTVPVVVYGIFRYLYLIHKKGAGGSPERVLLSDFPLAVAVLLFVFGSAWALYSSAA